MPPKRRRPILRSEIKRKTRSQTKEAERIARQNRLLAQQLNQRAENSNDEREKNSNDERKENSNDEREENSNDEKGEETPPENIESSGNSVEIQVLIASLNDEITRLRSEKER